METIDIHSHIQIAAAFDILPEKARSAIPPPSNVPAVDLNEAKEKLNNPEKRLSDMARMGISHTVISFTPRHFFYELDRTLALDISRKINNGIADIVEKYPEKLTGMVHVPLQDIGASVSELERAVNILKLKGVHIGSNVLGHYLGERMFLPFFEKAASLDIPVFVHPVNVAGADRLKPFYFQNLVGNPLDTAITAGSLIFNGVFDRLPGLKIILSHAGGMMPYNIDRWKHGFEVRPECREFIKKSPESYLRNFYYDTIAHGTESLKYLVARVGADRVVMGTDYPYDMGDFNPVQTVESLNLSAAQNEQILYRNSRSLFKM